MVDTRRRPVAARRLPIEPYATRRRLASKTVADQIPISATSNRFAKTGSASM